MSTFIAAGTAYATHGLNTIPFFIYYSMFGFQRIGDLIWAAADARCRGFLLGGTAGRTTLAARGCSTRTATATCCRCRCRTSSPTIRLRLRDGDHHPGRHPPDVRQRREHLLLPHGDERAGRDARDAGRRRRPRGHPEGLYHFKSTSKPKAKLRAQLLGSGAILPEVIKAQAILEEKYNVGADVWSVTSYGELYRDGHAARPVEHAAPGGGAEGAVRDAELGNAPGVFVAASDYLKALPTRSTAGCRASSCRSARTASAAARAAPTCATTSRWTRASSSSARSRR
jgi:pyruvate dehydrogenase E1 component